MDYRAVSCPEAETMLQDSISLPLNAAMTDTYIDQVAAAVAKVVRHYAR